MKFKPWQKRIWWFFLVLLLSYYLFLRFDSLLKGQSAPVDIFVFFAWAGLLAAPLFNEVNFFGIKLKQEMEETRRQLSTQLAAMETRIQNSVAVSPQFNFGSSVAPPPDSLLPELQRKLDAILTELTGNQPISGVNQQTLQVDEKVEYLFRVRLGIEKELRRFYKELSGNNPQRVPLLRVLPDLVNIGVISNQVSIAVRELYSVCSPAIHGEPVTDTQFEFVRNIAPQVISSLKATRVLP